MSETTQIGARALLPVRAQMRDVSAEAADGIDDWGGLRARAVVASGTSLPELAAADEDVDGFDPKTMTGEVVAYPSVLGRPYRMGFYTWHQIQPGAFDDSIAEQDGRVPVYVQHSWDWSERPPIGHTREAVEVDLDDDVDDDARALQIGGRLYPDVPDGLATLHGLAARALREWSIGYLIEEWSAEEDEETGVRTITIVRAQLWEASVVLRGANPWTQTLDVAGRPRTGGATDPGQLSEIVRAEVARQISAVTPKTEPDPPTPAELDWTADLAADSPSFRAALARTNT